MPLTGKQRRKLRALGHHLHPVVMVGHQGVTHEVIQMAEEQLAAHELIKVKLGDGPEERGEAAKKLAAETHSELAQLLGKTVLLFKKRKEKSKIDV